MDNSFDQDLALNRGYVAFQIVLAATFALAPIASTVPLWRDWSKGEAMRGGFSPAGAGLMCFLALVFFGYWVHWAYARTHVLFTPEALVQKGPIREKKIRWSEIRIIRRIGKGLHVKGEIETIVFAPLVYRNPTAAVELLFRTAQQHGAPV
jgi:hypothetical protein